MEAPNTEESRKAPENKSNNLALKGIRTFLETYPLQPSHVPNIQTNVDPKQKVGTVVLPLWQKTMEFSPGSAHWHSFVLLLMHCLPAITVASKIMQMVVPDIYKKARQVLLARGEQAPWREIGPLPNCPLQIYEISCFDTMRLTVNIAHSPAPLTTNHSSPYAIIIPLGEWEEGGAKIIMPQLGISTGRGSEEDGMIMLKGGQEVAVTPFLGERYQLELFVPEIPGVTE